MSECTVRRLHVAAASEPAARRFVTTLEDALRCATLPGDDRRVVVVRRLALGRVAHDAGTQRLSLLIEQRLARGDVAWAEAEEPPDPRADLIGFAGALEARVQLARRLVRGRACEAWYWPLAVAEYRRDLQPREALRRIAHALATLPEGRVALPEWIAQVVRAGGAVLLDAAIDEARGRALLRAAGIPWPVAAPASIDESPRRAGTNDPASPRAGASADTDASVRPLEATALPTSASPQWLRIALARARSEPVRLEPRAQLAVAIPAERTAAPTEAAASDPSSSARATHDEARPPIATPTAAHTPSLEATHKAAKAGLPAAPSTAPHLAPSAPPRPEASTEWHPTACGGLLFLLPVLARAGLVQQDSPEADRVAALQVLRAALRRVHAAPEDAAWALVDELSTQPPGAARAADDRALRELAAARRWLHRHARLGLVGLVLRPARLALTATHIDVRFPLSGADVRVRRLGLDGDPGWVPWFGRVIAFQFIGRLP